MMSEILSYFRQENSLQEGSQDDAGQRVLHEPLTLQSICADFLAKEAKRSFKYWNELAQRAEYFQTENCRNIMSILNNQAHSYYPMLIEKYSSEQLEEMYPWIEWNKIEERFNLDRYEKYCFVQMKGSVLERPSASYDPSAAFFSYDVLKAGMSWPPTVDPKKREQYLSDKDFADIFKMTKEEFNKLPRYKRDDIKKELKLF